MAETLKFHADETFEISGRGTAYAGLAPETSREERGADWVGRWIDVDGRLGVIVGVESFAVPRPIRKGAPVSFLIRFDE